MRVQTPSSPQKSRVHSEPGATPPHTPHKSNRNSKPAHAYLNIYVNALEQLADTLIGSTRWSVFRITFMHSSYLTRAAIAYTIRNARILRSNSKRRKNHEWLGLVGRRDRAFAHTGTLTMRLVIVAWHRSNLRGTRISNYFMRRRMRAPLMLLFRRLDYAVTLNPVNPL